jgi:hypothetical protein
MQKHHCPMRLRDLRIEMRGVTLRRLPFVGGDATPV